MNKRAIMLAVVLSSIGAAVVTGTGAIATHEPADKVVAAGDDLKATSANNQPVTVLQERMRVSTTADLVLQLSSECSILTSLLTNGSASANSTEGDASFGQVKMFIEIDGNRVPVSTNDTLTPPPEETDSTNTDLGEVVFCNRAYQRTVTDVENDDDGHDRIDDFIRTRTANAFNWLALNVGVDEGDGGFDDPSAGGGNNLVDVVVKAEFTKQPNACTAPGADGDTAPLGETCAEAVIGSRTLTIEPTHASVHEQPAPSDPGGT